MIGFTGQHLNALRYEGDGVYRYSADVSVGLSRVYIDGVQFTPEALRFLADMVDSLGEHTMSQCYWVDCPEHACPFTMSHLRDTCGRPTCRES